MADNLAGILSGQDPLSPEILQAIHNEQARDYVQNPANWQGGGLFGGLARIIAGAAVPNNTPTVTDITNQRIAAQPDEARLMASTDPYAAIAQNPDQYSPLARSMVLNTTPLQAAQTKEALANAGLAGLNYQGFLRAQGGTNQQAPISAPASKTLAPTGDMNALGTGRYPQQQADPIDQAIAAAQTPAQRQQLLQGPMRNAVLMRLRTLAGPKPASTTPAGAPGGAP